ncbi:hypothetical protein HMPREF0973_01523 [Prevotella veroralis F0319]|uniref:Uncharacterized protein n=1 Tax=Prevotella veroralis F0319 TaxID=649761 RepID=C9MPI2_9BACT|nr:hypothetical protein HMPREF0973_01523 [Prevotella veroralis F0319]
MLVLWKTILFTPLSIRRGDGGEAFLNTEYTDGTKPQGDTEFLTEHGNPQKLTPLSNSKFIIHNSKL